MINGTTTSGEHISIPESIYDISVRQWVDVAKGEDLIKTITGIHPDQIGDQAAKILGYSLRWITDGCFDFETVTPDFDMTECTYNAYKSSLIMIKSHGEYEALPFVYAAFTMPQNGWCLADANDMAEKIEAVPAIDIIPKALGMIKQLNDMAIKWSRLLSKDPDPQQLRAGVDKLNQFDDFGAIYNLAGRDLSKVDIIRNKSYNEILTALYYLRIESEFNTKYQDIIIQDQKNKSHGNRR